MTDQRTTIRGAELAYERAGAGPDLIWGHGLSQTCANEGVLPLLDWSHIPAKVVRYDARGHGLSETTPERTGYSWEALARDQLGLADHLGIGSYIAGGASMGTGTALHAAVLAPERISRLILTIPPTGWETRATQADQWELTAQIIENQGVEPIIEARSKLAPPDPFVGDDARREAQAAATRSWDPDRLAQVMRGATTANLPTREQIAAIRVPTLILAWTGDPIHPISTAEELVSLIADAELHVASTAEEFGSWTGLVARFLST